ncbi:MAG: zinc finger protein [Sciscionella sp.]
MYGEYQWIECRTIRHATRAGLDAAAGRQLPTLCGSVGLISRAEVNRTGPALECAGCDRVWREHAGIPQRAERLAHT